MFKMSTRTQACKRVDH